MAPKVPRAFSWKIFLAHEKKCSKNALKLGGGNRGHQNFSVLAVQWFFERGSRAF
jgi:hypothetical protein